MARIQRHHDATRRRYRHVDFEVLVTVQRQNGHAIARLATELAQGAGQAAAAGPGLGVGQTHVAIDHGDTVSKQLLGTGEWINKGVHGASSRLQRSESVLMILIRFETDNTLSIIKTDDKSFEQRDTPKHVKRYCNVVREPNAARETIALELYINGVQVDRDEATITYLDIDTFTLLPDKAKKQRKIGFKHTIEGTGIHIRLDPLPLA